MKHVISTPNAPAAIGPYSQAVGYCKLVFVSGQLPVIPESGALLTGPIGEQTTQCLKNIQAILAADGASMANIVKTTIFLRDMADFAEVNAAYAAFFPTEPPARACVQVARLPKDAAIEIEAIACKD